MKTGLSSIIFLTMITLAAGAQTRPEIVAQVGHSSGIYSISESNNGRYFVTSAGDMLIKLWNRYGFLLRTFKGHKSSGFIYKTILSGDNRYILSYATNLTMDGYKDSEIILWDSSNGEILSRFDEGNKKIVEISFSPDSRTARFCLFHDNVSSLMSFDIATNKMKIKEIKPEIIGINNQWDRYAAKNEKNEITIIDEDGNTRLAIADTQARGDEEVITEIVFSMGKYIALIYKNGECKIFTITGELMKNFEKQPEGVFLGNFNFSTDEHLFLFTLWDTHTYRSTIFLYNESGTMVNEINLNNQIENLLSIDNVNFKKNEKQIICTCHTSKNWWQFGHDTVVIIDYNGDIVATFNNQSILASTFTLEGKNIAIGYNDGLVTILNNRLDILQSRKETGGVVSHIRIHPTGNPVIYSINNAIYVYDRLNNSLYCLGTHQDDISSIVIDPGGNYLLSGSRTRDLGFSLGSSRLYFKLPEYSTMKLWDLKGRILLNSFEQNKSNIKSLAFSPDSQLILSGHYAGRETDYSLQLWTLDGNLAGRAEEFINTTASDVSFSDDGKYIMAVSDKNPPVLDHQKDKTSVYLYDTDFNVKRMIKGYWNAHFIPGSNKYGSVILENDCLRLISWDMDDGDETIKDIFTYKNSIPQISYTDDHETYVFISSEFSSVITIYNVKTDSFVHFTSTFNNWLCFTGDGYWDSSPNGGELVAMVRGIESWNIDQFAARNNRPDIILSRLPDPDPEVIAHYRNQYLKRLKRLGLTEDKLKEDYELPSVKILESKQDGKYAVLNFELSSENWELARYTIFVNDVPLFGSSGRKIKGRYVKLKEKVELTNGKNKIELGCMNSNGAESFRPSIYFAYNKTVNRDLYFLGFGVSEYNDESLDLKYAAKDVKDLAILFSGMKGNYFRNVFIKTILDKNVNEKAIRNSKSFVKDAKPDDTFVLFISGHGVHDTGKNATYYYLTYDTDIKSLAGTAADFEVIEDLLQGIQPRYKLFLMDTCESGEIDEAMQETYYTRADSKGIRTRTSRILTGNGITENKGIILKKKKRGYLPGKDRYIYNDLVRRSGSIVFSSCLGNEFSYEEDEIENGFFTEAVLSAFSTGSSKSADLNGDGSITTKELMMYVSEVVVKATGGLQHPTIDRDNIYQTFAFPVKKD